MNKFDFRRIGQSFEDRGVSATLRTAPTYQTHTDCIIDCTMSCDPQEAVSAIKGIMNGLIGQGTRDGKVRNDDYRIEFQAAYDLYKSITKNNPALA